MYWDKVLDGAEGMLHQTKFDEGFVSAVRTAATNAPRKKRRAFTRRSVTMLIQAVEMKGLDPMTRYQALQALSAVDRKTGARLARLHAESEVPLLRSAAAVVLGSAKTARKK
jgi:hypothetical protein